MFKSLITFIFNYLYFREYIRHCREVYILNKRYDQLHSIIRHNTPTPACDEAAQFAFQVFELLRERSEIRLLDAYYRYHKHCPGSPTAIKVFYQSPAVNRVSLEDVPRRRHELYKLAAKVNYRLRTTPDDAIKKIAAMPVDQRIFREDLRNYKLTNIVIRKWHTLVAAHGYYQHPRKIIKIDHIPQLKPIWRKWFRWKVKFIYPGVARVIGLTKKGVSLLIFRVYC